MGAEEIIENAKKIRQRLRYPPNAVPDRGIDLTRKSTAHKGSEPIPDPPIKKILREETPPIHIHPEIRMPASLDIIIDAVGSHYGVTSEAIKSSSRRSYTCFARFVVIYLAIRLLPKKSLASIARELGRDHTTILHARGRIYDIIAGNPGVAAQVRMIEACIAANNPGLAVPAIGQRGMEIESGAGPQGQEIPSLDSQCLGVLASAEARPEAQID